MRGHENESDSMNAAAAPSRARVPSSSGVSLIVNADDFGASPAVNEAVARGVRQGILTSCSLMATGAAFEEAARMAHDLEGLAVGLHLVTVLDRSLLGHGALPAITERDGAFSSSPTLAGIRYFASAKARRELERELHAQFRRAVGAGIALSHVDSHLHMHVNPVVFETAVKLAREHGVRAMRLPREEPGGAARRADPGASAMGFIFKLLCRRMERRLGEEGMVHADRIHGFHRTGRMTEDVVIDMLKGLDSGVNELYLHPAVFSEGALAGPEELQGRVEYEILVSPRVRRQVESLGIRLTDYRKLVPAGETCA